MARAPPERPPRSPGWRRAAPAAAPRAGPRKGTPRSAMRSRWCGLRPRTPPKSRASAREECGNSITGRSAHPCFRQNKGARGRTLALRCQARHRACPK
eukprot:scaffold1146_cov399-Prasinococcus_capsulatus_cf.AAC.73